MCRRDRSREGLHEAQKASPCPQRTEKQAIENGLDSIPRRYTREREAAFLEEPAPMRNGQSSRYELGPVDALGSSAKAQSETAVPARFPLI